jgi:hypothetical protein
MRRKTEYIEGPEAGENFERLAKALFRSPKTVTSKTKAKRQLKATARKKSGKKRG